MSLVCFDTNFVIWGIKREATPGQEGNIDRASHVVEQCSKNGTRILIPSIVLGELLSNLDAEAHDPFVQMLAKLFIIAPYDSRAAIHYARMWKNRSKATGLPFTRGEMRADFMIAAVAIANKCECIYSHDQGFANFASPFISIIPISQIVLPASQPSFPDMQ